MKTVRTSTTNMYTYQLSTLHGICRYCNIVRVILKLIFNRTSTNMNNTCTNSNHYNMVLVHGEPTCITINNGFTWEGGGHYIAGTDLRTNKIF